jgi:hypothetical protein
VFTRHRSRRDRSPIHREPTRRPPPECAVRRDLTGYQHPDPTRDAQRTWSVPLTLAEPGPTRSSPTSPRPAATGP